MLKSGLRADDIPVPSDAVETAVYTDEGFRVVLFDERDHAVHSLNPESSAIWTLIDGATSVEAICRELSELFGVDVPTVESDVDCALGDFWGLGLLAGSPAPSSGTDDDELRVLPRPPDP